METKKCSGCNATLIYDEKIKKFKCEYCGKICDFLDKYSNEVELDNEIMEVYETTCPECGARLTSDANTISTKCSYCNASIIFDEKVTRVYRPKKILLFELGVDAARKKVKYRLERNGIKINEDMLSKLNSIYIPYWLYNCVLTAESSQGNMRLFCKNALADASKKISDELSNAIEGSFNLEKLIPFDSVMITGYLAEKYDVDFSDLYTKISEKIRCAIDRKYNIVCSYTDISQYEKFYVLLPFYYLNFNGLEILVNGQNGAVVCNKIFESVKLKSERKASSIIRTRTCLLLCILLITPIILALGFTIFESIICGWIAILVVILMILKVVTIFKFPNQQNYRVNQNIYIEEIK